MVSDERANRFKKWVGRLPGSWESYLGLALSFYLSRHDPRNVEFEKYKNGYRITVRTDEVTAEEAYEFWNEYVEPEL